MTEFSQGLILPGKEGTVDGMNKDTTVVTEVRILVVSSMHYLAHENFTSTISFFTFRIYHSTCIYNYVKHAYVDMLSFSYITKFYF